MSGDLCHKNSMLGSSNELLNTLAVEAVFSFTHGYRLINLDSL